MGRCDDGQAQGEEGTLVGVDAPRGCEHGALGFEADAHHLAVGRQLGGVAQQGEPHEEGVQGAYATHHDGVVHVGVGAVVATVDQSGLRCGVELGAEGARGEVRY